MATPTPREVHILMRAANVPEGTGVEEGDMTVTNLVELEDDNYLAEEVHLPQFEGFYLNQIEIWHSQNSIALHRLAVDVLRNLIETAAAFWEKMQVKMLRLLRTDPVHGGPIHTNSRLYNRGMTVENIPANVFDKVMLFSLTRFGHGGYDDDARTCCAVKFFSLESLCACFGSAAAVRTDQDNYSSIIPMYTYKCGMQVTDIAALRSSGKRPFIVSEQYATSTVILRCLKECVVGEKLFLYCVFHIPWVSRTGAPPSRGECLRRQHTAGEMKFWGEGGWLLSTCVKEKAIPILRYRKAQQHSVLGKLYYTVIPTVTSRAVGNVVHGNTQM